MAENKKYYHNLDVVNNKVMNLLLNPLTTTQRTAVGLTLGVADQGYVVYDTTLNQQFFWNGTTWVTTITSITWGSITGTVTNQTDLTTYLSNNYYPLSSNPAGYLTSSSITGMVTGSGVPTRVAFWDTASSISSDSALYWDNSSKYLGIGIATPSQKLDVNGNANISGYLNFLYPGASTQVRIGANNIITGGISTAGFLTAIGYYAAQNLTAAGGDSMVALGVNAGISITSGGQNSVHIGRNSGRGITTGNNNTHIGMTNTTSIPSGTDSTIHIIAGGGYNLDTGSTTLAGLTTKYAFIGGGYNYATYINDFYLGAGPFVTDSSLANLSIYAPSASVTAVGTWTGIDAPGSNFTLNAGRGTGTGTPGDFIVKTANVTTSGNTQQVLAQRMVVKGDTGYVGIGTASPVYRLDVNGEINTNVGIRLSTNGAQTGFYSGANAFDVWTGNNKIATWGLASVGGTLYDHFMSWVYSSGTATSTAFRIASSLVSNGANSAGLNQLLINPSYTQQTFGTGTLRGVYYNPIISSLNGSTHIAWENTSGDIIHGNLAGSGTQMVTVDNTGKLGIQSLPINYIFSTGLTNNSNTITANLSTGIAGSQSVIGGVNPSESLTLSSTASASKGKIFFGTSVYDELNNRLGINLTAPAYKFEMEVLDGTNYTASSASVVTPTTAASPVVSISNIQNSNNGGSYLQLVSRNSTNVNQYFYLGAISQLNGYAPRVVLGMRTGATSYSERMRITSAGVGINTLADNNASAMFQLDSTTQGFLIPRMTDTQVRAIASPAVGLMAYNTTIDCPVFFSAAGWRRLSHSSM